jgi:phage shock protein A
MFTRVRRMFSAMFNWLMGKTEQQMTVPMLEQTVREMLESLKSLREATAMTLGFEARQEREFKVKKERVKTLQAQAEEALRQGNEKLARRALQLQIEAQGELDRADQMYKSAKVRADASRAKLKVEEEKVQEKIRKLGELKSIAAMNEAQKKMLEITDKYNIDGAMSTFDNAAAQIQEQSDKLAAYDKIAVSEGEELDKQLDQLTGKVKVDQALDDLKRKMGMIKEPAASQQQQQQQPEAQKISSAFDTEKES